MERGRILIMDEAPNARTALRELLEDEGYQVLALADGAGAIAEAERFHPDVALVDDSPRRAAGLGGSVSAVSILMSSVEPPRSANAPPCLRKPIDVSDLLEKVASGVERARRR